MARFVLVAGSCHGGWCWRETTAALLGLGHQVTALDLPGHGEDPTPRAGITLQDYAAAICAAMADGPGILLGHSMAGYPITAAADRDPAGIRALVYLCAYRPPQGQALSLADLRRQAKSQPLRGTFRLAGGCFTFDPAVITDRFHHDCPPGTTELALSRFTPEPVGPQETPVAMGPAAAALPQFYIRCTRDRAIPPEHQHHMAAGIPDARHSTLPASHSPFHAMPERLARRLAAIAASLD